MAESFKDSLHYQTLKKQIDQNNFSQAWQIAQVNADEYLGDASFDFLYGLAALNSNNIERAVFAFERVVANKPNWLDGQYYLAKAYFQMANYHAVIPLCQSIINQPNVADKLVAASGKLQQAAQTKLAQQSLYFKQFAGVSAGYDSNINAGIDKDSIYLPFLDQNIALSDNSKENNDNYLALNYHLNGSKALTQKSKLLFSGQANIHHFVNESDFNRMTLAGSVDYWQQFEQFDASVGVRILPLWFAGDYYRSQTSINTNIKKQLSQQWLVAGDFALGKTINSVNDTLDTNDLLLSLGSQYFIGRWRHSVSLSYLEEMSQKGVNDHISRKSTAFSYNNIWLIDPQWLASGTLSWQHQEYQGPHPFYFTKRVDEMWQLAAMLQFQQSKEISYRFNISLQDKDSNLDLFSYQRIDIGLSASMSF
jgi:hypothetical protein